MTRLGIVVALVALVAFVACGNSERSSNRNVAADDGSASAPSPAAGSAPAPASASGPAPAPAPAPATATAPGSTASTVEDWFAAYRSAHATASPANAVETGKAMWELLSSDAQKFVLDQSKQAVLAASKPVMPDPQELAYKIVGETAAARAAMMKDAKLTEVTPSPTADLSGKKVQSSKVVITSGTTKLQLIVILQAGRWKLDPSPDMVVREDELFKAPSTGTDSPHGLPTVEALGAAWKKTVDTGNGWDALNIMSPGMRKQLTELVARMGGSGMADVARIMEKTLVDRRNRGLSVKSVSIESRTDTTAALKTTYSNDESDSFTAVRIDGLWWLELKI